MIRSSSMILKICRIFRMIIVMNSGRSIRRRERLRFLRQVAGHLDREVVLSLVKLLEFGVIMICLFLFFILNVLIFFLYAKNSLIKLEFTSLFSFKMT